MRTSQALQPPWMPQPNTLDILPAGRWWDAIAVPQQPGLNALQILDAASHREPGPVLWEPVAAAPRLYFLVAAGAADGWKMAGTSALGAGCFVGVPGPTTIEPPGVHWLVPPDPDRPDRLVDAQALREALLRGVGAVA